MAIHFPARRYLTFAELIARWQCEANEVRAAIVSGGLVPSYFVQANLVPGYWEVDDDHDGPPGQLALLEHGAPADWVSDYLYLRQPYETGVLSCVFGAMCSDATEPPSVNRRARWYQTQSGRITLADVERQGVFLLTEIARFEDKSAAPVPTEGELHPRERDSLLRILYGMACAKPYLYNPSEIRNEATAKIADATVNAGCAVDVDTVRKFLKQAASQVGKAGTK